MITLRRILVVPFIVAVQFVGYSRAHDVICLTPDNYDQVTDGHTLFVKFFAPWCGHSKKMAPDWERLAKEWDKNEVGLIAEIDCTGAGKPLCDANRVKKFPTLKYGDPSALEFYEGPGSYDELAAFAEENLTPICTPLNLDACDEEEVTLIRDYQNLSVAEIEKRIDDEKMKIQQTKKSFDAAVNRLQKEYQALVQAKDKRVQDITSSDLRILKSIQKARATQQQHQQQQQSVASATATAKDEL